MKLSFDFDSTLSRKDVQSFAKKMVDSGHEVWIVTSRFDDETIINRNFTHIKDQNKIVFEVADNCGIKRENIKFTCMVPKIDFIKGRGFEFHLDDDEFELMDILESGDSCNPVNVNYFDWDNVCLEIVNKNKK